LGAGWTPEITSTFWKRDKYLEIFVVKDVVQRRLVVSYRRFGTTYRSHL